jgi:hypothetical protein
MASQLVTEYFFLPPRACKVIHSRPCMDMIVRWVCLTPPPPIVLTVHIFPWQVLCVGISTELDLVISGAKDGTCLLHTVRHGQYLHTLKPRKRLKCEIHQVAISNAGRLVIYTEDTTHRQRV